MTAASKTQFTTSGMIALAGSFLVSVASIAVGLALNITGTAQSTTAQIGAADGTIADAALYYEQLGNATSMAAIGTTLLGAGLVGLAVVLGMLAIAWRGAVVVPDMSDLVVGNVYDPAAPIPVEVSGSGSVAPDVSYDSNDPVAVG